jgi:chromatin modification-related protein EAF6
VYYAH